MDTFRTRVDMKGNWAQARGAERPDGNATLVGEWKKMPGITKHLMCIGTRRSTWVNVQRFYEYCKASRIFISCRVTDKGRPVLLGNMTFTWTAPSSDYGPIRCLLMINTSSNKCRQTWKNILFSFVLSVVKGNRYTEVSSAQIPFNAFPVSIRGFQTQCWRLNLFPFIFCFSKDVAVSCHASDDAQASQPVRRRSLTSWLSSTWQGCQLLPLQYSLTSWLPRDEQEVVISMGGLVEEVKVVRDIKI